MTAVQPRLMAGRHEVGSCCGTIGFLPLGAIVLGIFVVVTACAARLPYGPPVTPRVIRLGAGFDLLAAYEGPDIDLPEAVVADDHADLVELWRSFRLAGDPPSVDFGRVLVVGFAKRTHFSAVLGGPHCLVDGIHLTARRMLVRSCIPSGDSAISAAPPGFFRRVTVYTLDRWLLPRGELAFKLEDSGLRWLTFDNVAATGGIGTTRPGRPRSIRSRSAPAASQEVRDVLGEASVPGLGKLCLARLKNGASSWIVHHHTGKVSVIAGDYPSAPVHARVFWEFASAGVRDLADGSSVSDSLWGYGQPTRWHARTRTFNGLFDEFGSPIVAMLAPLDRYEYRELEGDKRRIAIGKRIPAERSEQPAAAGYWPSIALEGTPAYWSAEYERRYVAPGTIAKSPENSAIAVAGDLVGFPDGTVRICPMQTRRGVRSQGLGGQLVLREVPSGCDSSAAIVRGVRRLLGTGHKDQTPAIAGPLLVWTAHGRVSYIVTLSLAVGADAPVNDSLSVETIDCE